MKSGKTVIGTVTDSFGNPVEGAVVTLFDGLYLEAGTTTSDVNGNFEFVNVNLKTETCKVQVTYTAGDMVFNTKLSLTRWYSLAGTIIQIDRNDTCLIHYPPEDDPEGKYITVTGRVVDYNDDPVEGADVTLIDGMYRELGTVKTNSEGYFKHFVLKPKTDTCKVHLTYREGDIEYRVSLSQTKWYVATTGQVRIDEKDTKISDYPPPDSGYIWGFIQVSGEEPGQGRVVNGTVYLNNSISQEVTSDGASMGQFTFYVPVGEYDIYAVHNDGKIPYVSETKHVVVTGTRDIVDVSPTILEVKPEGLNSSAFLMAMVLGVFGLIAQYLILKKIL